LLERIVVPGEIRAMRRTPAAGLQGTR
jgi:hypothetical protein